MPSCSRGASLSYRRRCGVDACFRACLRPWRAWCAEKITAKIAVLHLSLVPTVSLSSSHNQQASLSNTTRSTSSSSSRTGNVRWCPSQNSRKQPRSKHRARILSIQTHTLTQLPKHRHQAASIVRSFVRTFRSLLQSAHGCV